MDRVNYKPLASAEPNCCTDEEASIVLNEDLSSKPINSSDPSSNINNKFYLFNQDSHDDDFDHYHGPSKSARRLTIRQFRLTLYILAFILFLLFLAQLFTHDGGQTNNPELKDEALLSTYQDSMIPFNPTGRIQPKPPIAVERSNDDRPQYKSYLTSVLNDRNSNHKESPADPFDDLHYPFSATSSETQQPSTIWWLLNLRNKKYVTVTNYVRAMKSFTYNSSITLTTQATTEFMHHTLELCMRWDGPISVAVFTPGKELLVAVTLIKFMRQCLAEPLSACVRDKVTWHLVYNKQHGPLASSIGYPKYHLDSTNYNLFTNQDKCPKLAGPDSVDLIKQFERDLKSANNILTNSYRQLFNLPYPINVLRNTARLAATTKYVLASDIELYPSINLVPWFIKFIRKHDIRQEYKYVKRFDFTLPIFEVKTNVTAPKTKQELVKLFKQKDAIFFHKYVCDDCQKFPNRLDWLERDTTLNRVDSSGRVDEIEDEIKIFEITQRNRTAEFWEPIFIGTNDDPLYDDRLTWDGRRDKMGHMYEMCLLDYHHFVLGNAFLVHAPGIKHIDQNDARKRIDFIRENNAIYEDTIRRLKEQYSNSTNIDTC